MTLKERFLRSQHAWMIAACYSRKHPDFSRYGGLDVGVSQRWRESADEFVSDMLDTLPRRLAERQIALRNPRRPFEPGNVEWVFTSKHEGLRTPDGARLASGLSAIRQRRI
jgi:hypothetical protein